MFFRTNAFCVLVLAAAVLPEAARAQDAVPTIDEIIRVARERQEAVKTGKFEWTVERWIKKGANDRPGIEMPGQPKGPNPPEDLEVSNDRSVLLSDNMLRYESFGPQLNHDTPFRIMTAWNGTKSNQFQDAEDFPSGRIESNPFFQYLDTFEPIGWTYRMSERHWARFDIQEFTVRPELELAGGEMCVVLEHVKAARARPGDTLFKRLWLSHDRSYVVRRFDEGRGATVYTRIEIDYEDSPAGIAVPVRWTKTKGEVSDPQIIEKCTVTIHELNLPVDTGVFELAFPANTWIEEEGVADPYMLRADGSRRTITQAELKRGAKYDDIAATPTGQAKITPLEDNSHARLFWIVQGVLAVVIVGIWYRTKLARRKT